MSAETNTTPRHPIQPLIVDPHGTPRFKKNAIVSYLLDHGGIDMNHLACIDVPDEDREQFAQLIGYSLGGFSELSYVSDDTYAAAVKMHESGQSDVEARCETLQQTLDSAREHLRDLVPILFKINPDDLES